MQKAPRPPVKSASRSSSTIVAGSTTENQEVFLEKSKYSFKFIPAKRGSPCPVCANDKGDCRYTTQDADFIQCHTYADARKLEIVNGYICVKEASGHTASFKKLGDRSLVDSQRLVERRVQRQKEQKEALLKGLSIEQRDKTTKILSKHLGLSTKHRQNLQNRGLTIKEIDAGYFFSVAPGDKLPFGIPANYPGATDGRLTVGAKGFACPLWSIDGLIIGWQLRVDDVVNNKYRWAKGNFSSHLPNGELPITVVRPSVVKHNWVADIEGVLKPYIAAQKLDAVCIGAAGGNIVGSSEQVKEAIAKLGITEIRDFPDAGDVWNRNVMQRRVAKYEFYRSLGLDVKVGWWGQVTKNQDCDIDELLDLAVIKYISVEEFLETARWHGGLNAKPVEPKAVPQTQSETKSDEYYSQRAKQLEEVQEQFEGHAIRHREELAAGAKLQWMLNYPERVKRTHEAIRSIDAFKPVLQESPFISLLVEEFLEQDRERKLTNLKPGFYGLKVSMGGGKSVQMRDVVGAFPAGNLLTFRNSIAMQFCHHREITNRIQYIWDIKGIQSNEEQRQAWIRAGQQWLGGCVESLSEFKPKDVLVLEEVEQLKRSLLVGSTCRRDRKSRLKLFQDHLEAAKHVFVCDADLSASTLKWLQALDPGKKMNIVHNTTKRFEWQCYFYTGIVENFGSEIKASPNNKAEFEHALLASVARGKKILVATDSQRWAETIERTIKMVNQGALGLRVDSTTKASDDPEDRKKVDQFLSVPNEWIEENQPDYVIYSPTAEASLDITVQDYFDGVFGCFVHANFLSCKQLLGRLRTNAPRHIFAKTHVGPDDAGSRSPLPQVLSKHMFEHNFETLREIVLAEYPEIQDDFQLIRKLNEIIDFESGQYKNANIQAMVEIRAQDNYSRSDLRKLLAEELESCGHVVTMLEPGDELMPCPSLPHRKEVIKEWAQAIANAEVITIEEARRIQSSQTSKMSDRHAATKAILQYRLPDYTITSEFLEDYYLDDRNWVTRQELRYLLEHPEMSTRFDQEAWTQALKTDVAWWDVRTNALKIKALTILGIPEIAKSGRSWAKDTDWLLEFKQLAIKHSNLVKLALNVTAREDSDPCYLLRRCLEQAGYPVASRSQHRVGQTRISTYKVDAKVLADNWSVYADVYKAITKRFEEKLSNLDSDAAEHSAVPIEIITSPVCVTTDHPTPTGLDKILDKSEPLPNSSLPFNELNNLELGDWVIVNLPKSRHNGRLAHISSIYRSCGQTWVSASFDDGTSQKVDLPIHEAEGAFIKQAIA